MINIACVWIPPKYDFSYVQKLKNSVDRNLSKRYTFYVLTTHPQLVTDPTIKVIPLAEDPLIHSSDRGKWWYKTNLFAEQMWQGRVLYLDLDTVIINNIDKLFDFNLTEFVICQDFNRHGNPNYQVCNSSVMCFDANRYTNFFEMWKNDSTSIVRKHKGDQDWITELLGGSKVWWPYEWVMSFKWEVLNGGLERLGTQKYKDTETQVSQETSILVFHGRPNPEDVTDDIIVNNWK